MNLFIIFALISVLANSVDGIKGRRPIRPARPVRKFFPRHYQKDFYSYSADSSGKVNDIRYTERLESLEVGTTITISALLKEKKFEIYFHRHGGFAIVPLYISVNPEDQTISFSTKRISSWEIEEKRRLPTVSGEMMTIQVIVTEDGYKITINEEWLKFYEQRMFPSHMDQLTIGGDVLVNTVVVEEPEEEDEEGDEYVDKEDEES